MHLSGSVVGGVRIFRALPRYLSFELLCIALLTPVAKISVELRCCFLARVGAFYRSYSLSLVAGSAQALSAACLLRGSGSLRVFELWDLSLGVGLFLGTAV